MCLDIFHPPCQGQNLVYNGNCALQRHSLRIHRCATRDISCLMWMAWVRHTHAHFWQVQMQDFIRN